MVARVHMFGCGDCHTIYPTFKAARRCELFHSSEKDLKDRLVARYDRNELIDIAVNTCEKEKIVEWLLRKEGFK